MTHSDIYTKFMIEYDKENITSSYPSLTKYEIATILDKAYLALIAQKFTGNNTRNKAFEGDIKAIEDLQPLITYKLLNVSNGSASNEYKATIPSDMLHYVGSQLLTANKTSSIDNKKHFKQNINIISHHDAYGFMATTTNMPWIKQPVGYMQDGEFHVLYDGYDISESDTKNSLVEFTYIKKPKMFVTGSNINTSDNIVTPPSDTVIPDPNPEPGDNSNTGTIIPPDNPGSDTPQEPDLSEPIKTEFKCSLLYDKFDENTASKDGISLQVVFESDKLYAVDVPCTILKKDNTFFIVNDAHIQGENSNIICTDTYKLSYGEYYLIIQEGGFQEIRKGKVYTNNKIQLEFSVVKSESDSNDDVITYKDPRYGIYGFPGEYAPTGYDGDLHEWIDYVPFKTCKGNYWAPCNVGSTTSYGTDKWYCWGETFNRTETPSYQQYSLFNTNGSEDVFTYSNNYDEKAGQYNEIDKKYFPYYNDYQRKVFRMPIYTELRHLVAYSGGGTFEKFNGVDGLAFGGVLFLPIPKKQYNPNNGATYNTGYLSANTCDKSNTIGAYKDSFAKSLTIEDAVYNKQYNYGDNIMINGPLTYGIVDATRNSLMQIRPVYTGKTDVQYTGPKKKNIKAVVFDFDTPEKYGVTKTSDSVNVTDKKFTRGPIEIIFDKTNGIGAFLCKYGDDNVLSIRRHALMKIKGENIKLLEIAFSYSSIAGDMQAPTESIIGLVNNKNEDWHDTGHQSHNFGQGQAYKWSSQEEYKTDIKVDNGDGSTTITDGWIELKNPITTNYATFFQAGEPSQITNITIFYQEV